MQRWSYLKESVRGSSGSMRSSLLMNVLHSNNTQLNRAATNGVDNFIILGGEAGSELRPRKPDRVYGLQQTKLLGGNLGDVIRIAENRTERKVDITPFDNSTDPIIFPFLISEASSEKSDSFEACERQLAFPIWKLLCLQEGLEKESKRSLVEQGGPLVWFLANRGQDWRVYGCYTKPQTEVDRASYVSETYCGLTPLYQAVKKAADLLLEYTQPLVWSCEFSRQRPSTPPDHRLYL